MKLTKLAVIAALLGYTMAVGGTIKNRLSEIQAQSLAQVETPTPLPAPPGDLPDPSLAFCDCSLTGSPPPVTGNTQTTTFSLNTLTTTGSSVGQIPNQSSATSCRSDSCACEAETEQEVHEQLKTRNFCISGNIMIEESVTLIGSGQAQEESAGRSQKVSTCGVTNLGGSGSPPTPPGCPQ